MRQLAIVLLLGLYACDDPAAPLDIEVDDELDVFLVGGQSNARGSGDHLLSPDVPEGIGFVWSAEASALIAADDPVGDARTGSAWPAFVIRYNALTNRKAVIVPRAVGGSAQHVSAADVRGHWDVGGALYPASVQAVREAMAGIRAIGKVPVFRGVIWDQGGRDANSINIGATTKEQYRGALEAMLARYRGELAADMPFWIILLGTDAGDSPIGWTQVREAQQEVAAADPFTHLAFAATPTFHPSLHVDRFHYNQEGLNRIGRGVAEYVAAELFPD